MDILKENYDPDGELCGSGNVDLGHNIADYFFRKGLEDIQEPFDEELAKEILSGNGVPSAKHIYRSSKKRSLLKGRLGRLKRDANMNIEYSPSMSTNDMWKMYNDARRRLNQI